MSAQKKEKRQPPLPVADLSGIQKVILTELRDLQKREQKARVRFEKVKSKARRLLLELVPCPECTNQNPRKHCPVCDGFGELMVEVSRLNRKSGRRRKP
ncbi:MAG: hypothetical protein Q8R76_07905 [Candidatus Omnitrophota bacterium]|nr:hypothetical protein [Candidatus Omnitrophota bacterium]